jgi:hypothetical protein
MSVGRQFKRIGEIAVALGLWKLVFWLFSKPKRILIFFGILFIIIFLISSLLNNKGDKFYVNTNELELLDKPFGKTIKTLKMNDSLIYIKEMSDNWMQVAVDIDTFYFKDNFYYNENEQGYTYKIEKTPFTKWKALQGHQIEINHPNGFLETGDYMLKNGDKIEVLDYLEDKKLLRFTTEDSYKSSNISVEYVKINWSKVLKKYPSLQ